MTQRLGGHAEYADRVPLGPIELIVRDVDEKGRIAALGLSFEPTAPVPRVPVFLSAGEIGDRLAASAAQPTAATARRACRAGRPDGTPPEPPLCRHTTPRPKCASCIIGLAR